MRKCAAVVMASVVSFVAVVRGEALCFCDEDPDDCGQACHECGTSVPEGLCESQGCQHLELTIDLAMTDDGVALTSTDDATSAPLLTVLLHPFGNGFAVLRTTSPPLPRLESPYCSCSSRLFPRS